MQFMVNVGCRDLLSKFISFFLHIDLTLEVLRITNLECATLKVHHFLCIWH